MDTTQAESCAVYYAYNCIALGVPILIRGSQNPMKMGTHGRGP